MKNSKRKKGIGTVLLKWVKERTRNQGKSFIRLFTSDAPNEMAAQKLYEEHNYRIIKDKARIKRNNFETFFRELKL